MPDFTQAFQRIEHDANDPNPWQAMYLDNSIPIYPNAKAALLLNNRSRSRQFLLPILRPLARLAIIIFQLLKIFIPKRFAAPVFMHKMIFWGLKTFVRPEANYVILRHFHIGTEILAFISRNAPVDVETLPLRPETLADLQDNVFVQHDMNLYNFVIRLNQALQQQQTRITSPKTLDFQDITDGEFPIQDLPDRWHNVIDVQTAIEIYTPLYQLLLTDDDFWRATNSLQLDETVALYIAQLLGDRVEAANLTLLNNKHPLIPLTTLRAAYRLMLHGLASESLHALLVQLKRAQAAA